MNDGWNEPINERVAKLEQWRDDHENRHVRDSEALLLAVRNEIILSSASDRPMNAMLKWVGGVLALVLVALLGWLLKR